MTLKNRDWLQFRRRNQLTGQLPLGRNWCLYRLFSILIPLSCTFLRAGTETRLSASLSDEAGYLAGLRIPGPAWSNTAVARASFLLRDPDRWTITASAYAVDHAWNQNHATLQLREAYGRVTLGDFDFSGGKRILRWSVGYAFTPAGVLDPPRNPTDPTDRLNILQGRALVSAEYIKGPHSVTAAYATGRLPDRMAFRYNALLAGFDTSLIYAKDVHGRGFTAANFTRVIGDATELHAEYAHRPGSGDFLIGAKYNLRSGVGFIGECYSTTGPLARTYAFLSGGKSRLRDLPSWKEWDLRASIILASDGGVVPVFDAARRFGNHFTAYLHAEKPGGSKTSLYGMIPYAAITSFGIRIEL